MLCLPSTPYKSANCFDDNFVLQINIVIQSPSLCVAAVETDKATLYVFQVLVLASMWGDGYYHFVLESLPRIVTMLDILAEHPDIKVSYSLLYGLYTSFEEHMQHVIRYSFCVEEGHQVHIDR